MAASQGETVREGRPNPVEHEKKTTTTGVASEETPKKRGLNEK